MGDGAFLASHRSRRVSSLLQAELFLNPVHESGTEFPILSVHRQHGQLVAKPYIQVTTMARFKGTSLFAQPPLELLAGH
jgi:hypothetical protein